jgi:putative ABC transport system permease protein
MNWFKPWVSRRQRYVELSESIREHLKEKIDDLVEDGLSRDEAEMAARREFGNVSLAEQRSREVWRRPLIEDAWADVMFAFRQLGKAQVFTVAVVLTLALGIGANAAVFSVVNAVLIKPLSYPNADRIVEFVSPSLLINNYLSSTPKFRAYLRQTSVFQAAAGYDFEGPGFNIAGGRPEQVKGIRVTYGYFRVFGAPVILGRTFTPKEDSPNGGHVVVLSYGLWQGRFGGDPDVVGKTLSIGNVSYTIIGVIGKDFVSDPEAEIWVPFQLDLQSDDGNNFFQAAALLKPGVTLAQANAQLKLAAAQYRREHPAANPQMTFSAEPLRDSIVGDARRSLLLLLGTCGFVLLIACANVANLLLVRAAGRTREFAIRAALGAGRHRIIRQLLTESILLFLAGGILGLVFGFAGVRALLAISPASLPLTGESGSGITMDWRVFAFTLSMSLVSGILFGLFPAVAAARADLNSSLNEGSSHSGPGLRQGRSRSLLVISEVSLALVLLAGAGLLIRSLVALHRVDPGFDSHNVLTAEMALSGGHFDNSQAVADLSKAGRDRLDAIPGVEAAASTEWLPNLVGDGLGVRILDHPEDKGRYFTRWMSASPGYLTVFKIPILRGRDIDDQDTATSPPVVLINQAMAKRFWPKEDPVGKKIFIGADHSPRTIIGVTGDTRNFGLERPSSPTVIVPLPQVTDWYMATYSDGQPIFWVVRTRSDPHQFIAAVAEQLRIASGGFALAHVRTMDEIMGRSTARENLNMILLSIFGAIALVLAAIGVYGLMAYSVEQRAREMGIRIALGASRKSIGNLVVWQGMKRVFAGVAIGIVAALGLTQFMAALLFGVHPRDPAVFITVPILLSVVAFLAIWWAALRAMRIDPLRVLRAD